MGAARLDLAALGDFPISNRTSESLPLNAFGTQLSFPAESQAVAATASSGFGPSFIGYGERRAELIDVILWPEGGPCDLFRPSASDSFPGKIGGEALGFAHTSGLVLLAGSNDATSAAIVGALTFDAQTGDTHIVDPRARAVLSEPRAFATVSDFAGKVLVAGGENPVHDLAQPESALRETAEVYDPISRSFEPNLVTLAEATTRQAAVLLKSGETLLLGGRDAASDASSIVQVISPETRLSKLLEPLTLGRTSPTALCLSDGRILVAGGTDEGGHPVAGLEWRAADGSKLGSPWNGSLTLPARYDRAFVALPGGAALSVGGCEGRAALPGEDCSVWCAHGCPPATAEGNAGPYDAFWIGADGSIRALDLALNAPRPFLMPGSDGSPWLLANDTDSSGAKVPGTTALYRFDPWHQRFDAADADLEIAPEFEPRFVSTGPDAFIWLESDSDGPVLRGVRLGTRAALTSDLSLVSLRAEDSTRPAHLAPDYPPTAVNYDSALGRLSFSALAADAPATCVWLADADFGDFSAQISFSTQIPPSLRLGDVKIAQSSAEGGSTCTLPALSAVAASGDRMHLRRTGNHISMQLGSASSTCELGGLEAPARIPFGLCQSELGPVSVTELDITRGN